jgi:hypothetical protein
MYYGLFVCFLIGSWPQRGLAQLSSTFITAKWLQLGGATVVGGATSAVQDTPEGGGAYQIFTNGVIVYSNDFGAVYITQVIFDKWLSLQSDTTADGTNLFTFVGVPTQDFVSMAGHQEGTFERARIIVAGDGARVVYGDIYGRYLDLAGVLGLPLSAEANSMADGRFQVFEGGEIHWQPDLGAFGVWGPILDCWKELGGPGGTLGFPNADVNRVVATDGRTPIGLSGRFENGAIFSSDATGAWEVIGEMLTNYEKRFGGPAGWLGFPTSGEGITGSGDHFNNFQGGMLVNHLAADAFKGVLPFGAFDFFLRRIQGFGDDCVLGICGGQDVYAYLTVTTPAGPVINGLRLPSRGNGGSSVELNRSFALGSSVANSAFRVDVALRVWDADAGDDDSLGTVSDSYTINNLWGLLKSPDHRSGNAGANFTVRSTRPYDRNDFRGQLWWSFDNFKTPELSYDQFATTFVDVDPDEFAWRHPFNKLYYELAYKKIAKQGNCFGMSLESIYSQLNRSPYTEPIHDYFPDTQDGRELMAVDDAHAALMNELNIKHGYQLSATGVAWFLTMFTTGNTHNPVLNFIGASLAHAIGDYPLIAMYDSYLFGNGHVVRPYDFVPVSTSCKFFEPPCSLIRIANPNNPTGTDPTDDPIEIDPITNAFRYRDYSGNFLTGGRMFFMPFSLFSGPQRTPLDGVLQLLGNGFLFALGTTGQTHQITDGEGRTFFKTDLAGSPTFWDDIRREDDPTLVPNLAPIALTDQALPSTSPIQMFAGRGVGATHTYQVLLAPDLPGGTLYEATFESAKLSSYFAIPGTPDKPESITAHDIGGLSKAISLSLPFDSETKAVTWTIAGPEKQRWVELTGLTMVPGQEITISLENAGRILIITNTGAETSANLHVKAGPCATAVEGGTLHIPSGTSVVSPGVLQHGRLAFTTDRDGDHEVYVMNADGCAQVNLTNNAAANDSLPVWSPDGQTLAFASDRDGNAEVYVMNADGSAQTNLTNHPAFDSEPAWSPDGTKLAFESERDGNREIYVMNANGSGLTNLTNHPADDGEPAWSPDGMKLVFTSNRNGDFEVYVMNADGSGQTNLTNHPAFDSEPEWQPVP